MLRSLSLITFIFLSTQLSAQFGLNGRYVINEAGNWIVEQTDGQENLHLLDNGYAVGIDYWFRFKDLRIEFLPELNYSSYESTLAPLNISTEAQMYSLLLNTNIYFLDMSGDCFCPTFYQEGPTLQKGLHLQISPGLHYFDGAVTTANATASSTTLSYSIGAGLGFDLGLSKNLTITPIAGVRYFPNLKWEAITEALTPASSLFIEEESSIWQYSAGIRIGLRLGE